MTAVSALRVRAPNRVSVVTIIGASVLAALVARLAASGGLLLAGVAVAGPAALAVSLKRPKVAVVALLVSTGSLMPSGIGQFEVAGIRSDIPEMLLLSLLGASILTFALKPEPFRIPFAGALLALLAAAVFGAGVALIRGAGFGETLGPFKVYLFWLAVVPFAWCLRNKDEIEWLERLVIGLATAAAVVTLALVTLGVGVPTAETSGVTSLGITAEATRYRPAAVQLAFLATILLIHRATFGGWSVRRVFAMAALLTLLAASFTRSTWAALLVCVVAYALLRPGRRQPLRGIATGIVVILGVGAGLGMAASGLLGSSAEAIALRARSTVTPSVFEERSQLLRNAENEAAVAAIRRSPLVGVGLGQPFGGRTMRYSHTVGFNVYSESLLLHNTYLKLWLETGLPGVIAMIMLALSVWRMTRYHRTHAPPYVASRSIAAGLCLLGFSIQAIYQTKLYHRPTIVAIAVALALLAATDQVAFDPQRSSSSSQ